jgi:hypothetical protein
MFSYEEIIHGLIKEKSPKIQELEKRGHETRRTGEGGPLKLLEKENWKREEEKNMLERACRDLPAQTSGSGSFLDEF